MKIICKSLPLLAAVVFSACASTKDVQKVTERTEQKVEKNTTVEINPEKGVFHHDNSTMYSLLDIFEKAATKQDSITMLAIMDEEYKLINSKHSTEKFLNNFFFSGSQFKNASYKSITKLERQEIQYLGGNYKVFYKVFFDNTQITTSWFIVFREMDGIKRSYIRGNDVE